MLKSLTRQITKTSWSESCEILSTYAGIDSMGWKLGLINSLDNLDFQSAITKLASEALVPNPFFELPILKAALKNFNGNNVQFLFLSKQIGNEETLKFFAPVCLSPIGIFRQKVLQTWNHVYAPLGMPLIAHDTNGETQKAFIECIKIAHHDTAKAIVFKEVSKEGHFINDLCHSRHLSDKLLLAKGASRAGLKPIKNLNYEDTYFSGKRKQRLRKAKTELEALGSITFHDFYDQEFIDEPLEEFFKLEESSWKGKSKTALNSTKSSAAFCREAVSTATLKEKCQMHSLKLNDKTIASLITFKSNGFFYPWKIAFDEDYAKYSAGNILTTYATGLFANKDCFKGLDSLASEHNETTLRFWPDEKEFFTMIIGIGKDATKTALSITDELNRIKRIKTTLRSFLKKHRYFERFVSSLRM